MNKVNRARLLGMAIGDGCLVRGERDYVSFTIAHTTKQYGYLEYKRNLMHSIVGGKMIKIHKVSQYLAAMQKTYTAYRFSKQHKYFKLLRRWLYNGKGVKTITPKILNYLTPEAIAYWYMDDGGLTINLNKEGNVSSFEIRLYTYCTKQEVLDIQSWLKETYDIEAKIPKYGKKEQWNIRMNTTNSRKFLALTEEFKVPCMSYKWDICSKTRARNISMNSMSLESEMMI